MKQFINREFNDALNNSFSTVMNDELDYKREIWGIENITNYGWECFQDEAINKAYKNESDVLRRHYGKPGSHQNVYGRCFNPIS